MMTTERLSAADLREKLGQIKRDPSPAIISTPAPAAGFRRGAQAAAVAAPKAPLPPGVRPNRYGGKCVECAVWVPEGEGLLVKTPEGKWGAQHLDGGCASGSGDPREGDYVDPPPVAEGFVKITAITGQTYIGLQPGTYTLATKDGHRTFRVRVQSTDDDFHPGSTILEYLSGPDNERDYTGFGFLRGTRLAVWSKHKGNEVLLADATDFLADPSKALLAARCIRCNKKLSTLESIEALMGKSCREKGW